MSDLTSLTLADARDRLKTNSSYQTEVEHIYAVGDVIGFPSLASTSKEQGRIAVCRALGDAQYRIARISMTTTSSADGTAIASQAAARTPGRASGRTGGVRPASWRMSVSVSAVLIALPLPS